MISVKSKSGSGGLVMVCRISLGMQPAESRFCEVLCVA